MRVRSRSYESCALVSNSTRDRTVATMCFSLDLCERPRCRCGSARGRRRRRRRRGRAKLHVEEDPTGRLTESDSSHVFVAIRGQIRVLRDRAKVAKVAIEALRLPYGVAAGAV